MLMNPEFRNPTFRKRVWSQRGHGPVPCIRDDSLPQLGSGTCAHGTLSQNLNVTGLLLRKISLLS